MICETIVVIDEKSLCCDVSMDDVPREEQSSRMISLHPVRFVSTSVNDL